MNPFRFATLLLSFHKKELPESDEAAVREVLDQSPELDKLDKELNDKEKIRQELELIANFDTEKALRKVRYKKRADVFTLPYRIAAAAVLLTAMATSVFLLVPRPEKQAFFSEKLEKEGVHVTLHLADGQLLRLDTLSTYQKGKQVVLQNRNGVLNITDKLSLLTRTETASPNRLEVPFKTTYRLVLPDGTAVWLNAGSRLDFPSRFDQKERRVFLEGEAFFEVVHRDKQPFVVATKDVSVQVLGTAFNVKAYRDEEAVYTTLIRGKVAVADRSGQSKQIEPGEQATYDKNNKQVIVKAVDTQLFTAWKDGSFTFENAPLNDILRRIGRWYNLNVVYKQSNLKYMVYSGKMEMYDSVEDVLRKFEKSGDLHFELEGNTIAVSKS